MSLEKSAITIEALGQDDLAEALELQRETYPPYLVEEEGAFISRINLATSYCLVAKHRERLLGYLLAHGWKHRSPPPLGASLADGASSEVLFIHDLAVSASSRSLGIGERLITRAFEMAAQDGVSSAELIAVEGAAHYWHRLGFVEEAISSALSEKVATYGTLARWMTRKIPPTN